MTYANSIHSADTRIVPIRPENQVETVTKNSDGSLVVRQKSGQTFTIEPGDDLFQAFIIYTMLNSEARQ